jgi:KipI family sensor histidine kinase inhibitor
MAFPTLEPLGDQALLLRWGEVADADANRLVHAAAARLRAARLPWLVDCVPAYASLAVFFDGASIHGDDPFASVREAVATLADVADATTGAATSRLVEIPVVYGGEHGPDLDDVAAASGLTPARVIERHAQADYLVAMLGFSPGFPYLLGLDPALAVPRLATPRTRVPAGSVGIGGTQTGIYPNEGPGGWRLIGRTPQALFDARRDPPSLLLPGDRVRFVPVAASAFCRSDGSRDASDSKSKSVAASAAPTRSRTKGRKPR